MPKKKKIKKQKAREDQEEQRCNACDCYETEDGCECRKIPCSKCGITDYIYNMNHELFHSEYWFRNMAFETKLSECLCDECENKCEDEDENDY